MSKAFNGNWILTDDDSVQHFRELETTRGGDKLFELFQVQAVAKSTGDDPKIYRIAHEFIYRSEIDVEDVLDGYCYDSLEEMREIYGDKTDQALAECQFEFDASGGDNLIARMPLMTWEEAKETIEKMINVKAPSWKVVMVSGGETKKDFSSDYPTKKEAEEFAASLDWHYIDENQFEWGLEVEKE